MSMFTVYIRLIFLLLLVLTMLSCKTTSARISATATDLEKAAYKDASLSVDARVQDLLSYMTLEEKVGQMTLVEQQFLESEVDVTQYHIGSLFSSGGRPPDPNTPLAWAEMVDHYQKIALSTRLGIPLLYGTDAVHGHNNVFGATIFPHNIGLGCTNNPDLVKAVCRATALEVAATGIDWTFAPCVAVPRDARWGRTYEGYAETPSIVARLASAAVNGYQNGGLENPNSILACVKHYIGDGGTVWGTGLDGKSDKGDTQISEVELRKTDLPGYVSAVKAGAGSVMASYNQWNGIYCHANKYLLTDLLKGELGFTGFVVSDWAGIGMIPGGYLSAITVAINAGIDMAMIGDKGNYEDFIRLTMKAVEKESIPVKRIDDAVARILRIKFQLGLFENPYADKSLLEHVGSEEHRAIAREAVRQSLVLLKNDQNVLPLSKTLKKIHVGGKSANDLGNQCGGWTISWQGESGPITEGATILEAIENAVSSSTEVTTSIDGSGAEGADVAIAVVGETPYAEFKGDNDSLTLDKSDLEAITRMQSFGIPVIVILISGRPLIIEAQLKDWDALIAAWLPGTEGYGVADVLFGDYNPSAKLSVSWPRSLSQIPLTAGDPEYDPLFEYGFGLRY